MARRLFIDNGPGKAKVYVDDSYCVKTKEEVDAILRECSRIYYTAMLRQEIAKHEQEQEKTS